MVGVKLVGKLPEGATATDLVLRVTEMLRKHGVVGKFVHHRLGLNTAHTPTNHTEAVDHGGVRIGADQ